MKYKIIPKFLKKFAYQLFKKLLIIRDSALNNNNMPNYEFNRLNVKNTKVLINRKSLLELLPNDCVCAEIGVNKGKFSQQIIDICKPKKLHLIDSWGSERYHTIRKRSERKI